MLKNQMRWCLFVFLMMLLIDWLYIFILTQNAYIVNSVSILMPFLIPLMAWFGIAISIRFYYGSDLAFLYGYLLIILSMFCMWAAHHYIIHVIAAEEIYFTIFMMLNIIILIYLFFTQMVTRKVRSQVK